MVRDTKNKNNKKTVVEDRKKRLTRGKPQPPPESSSEEEDDEEAQMDALEYRKFLSTIFPSKNMSKKVKDGEKLKQVLTKDLKKIKIMRSRRMNGKRRRMKKRKKK